MEKSTFTPLYDYFRSRLVEIRNAAGMTQRDLAEKLGREHSFVGRVELGERRIDVVEFFWICRALGADPTDVASELMTEFERLNRRPKRKKKTD